MTSTEAYSHIPDIKSKPEAPVFDTVYEVPLRYRNAARVTIAAFAAAGAGALGMLAANTANKPKPVGPGPNPVEQTQPASFTPTTPEK